MFPKAICRFNKISNKITMTFFIEMGKSILKFTWKHKRSQIDKETLNKKSKAIGITISDVKIYYRAIVTKTALC
jgi:exoribonuclease II